MFKLDFEGGRYIFTTDEMFINNMLGNNSTMSKKLKTAIGVLFLILPFLVARLSVLLVYKTELGTNLAWYLPFTLYLSFSILALIKIFKDGNSRLTASVLYSFLSFGIWYVSCFAWTAYLYNAYL